MTDAAGAIPAGAYITNFSSTSNTITISAAATANETADSILGAQNGSYDPCLNYIDGLRFNIRNGDALYLGNSDGNGIENGYFFIPNPVVFTATFTTSSTVLTVVGAWPGLFPNEYLTDATPGHLPANVYIVSTNQGASTITISANPIGNSAASPGDAITAANIGNGIVFQDDSPAGTGYARHNNLKNMQTARSGVVAQDTNTYIALTGCTTVTASGVTTVTCSSTSNLAIGNFCYAPNIAPQTLIASITSGTQFTLSQTSIYDVASPGVTFSVGAWVPSGPNYLELNLGNQTAVNLPTIQNFAELPRYAEGVQFGSGMVAGCFVASANNGDTASLGSLQDFIYRMASAQPGAVNCATAGNTPAIYIENNSTGTTASITLENSGSLTITDSDGDTVSITGASAQIDQVVALPFSATFSTASKVITVTSAFPSVCDNMLATDTTTPGNIASGTTISSFSASAGTITLSAFPSGNSAASPGDTISPTAPTPNTTADTVLMSFPIPGGTFLPGSSMSFLANVTYGSDANGKTLKITFGSLTMTLPTVTTNGGTAKITGRVWCIGTSAQNIYIDYVDSAGNFYSNTYATTQNTSSTIQFKIHGQNSVATSGDISCNLLDAFYIGA